MGTIVILFVYFLTTLSPPVFMWRPPPGLVLDFRHVVIPIVGSLARSSLHRIVQAGPARSPTASFLRRPCHRAAVATAIACVVVHRHPRTGNEEGTKFSDA